MRARLSGVLITAVCAVFSGTLLQASDRVDSGLVVLYDFKETKGNTVHDRSGIGEPLHLTIEQPDAVRWTENSLHVTGSTRILSKGPARKVIDAVKRSGGIAVEAWVVPENLDQDGPARLVSISRNTSLRNVTLGQDKQQYDFRIRVNGTSDNGMPSTATPAKSAETKLTHIVTTLDASGTARVFINGQQVAKEQRGSGMRNWAGDYALSLANEATGDRPWKGELHLVAIYDRALTPPEVRQNFEAGHKATAISPEERAQAQRLAEQRRIFDEQIAPLFARHCLECHDRSIRKGNLDLSRQTAALAGGDGGKGIVPGKANESLVWQMVEGNDMPLDRAPLSADEKTILREWIERGAQWSTDVIDPVIYKHNANAGEVWVQRLTIPEYIETVKRTTGVDISKEARELLPPDLRADGFSNTAYNLNIDLQHVSAYSQLAEIIVERMDIREFASRFSKSRQFNDDKMREVIAAMGKTVLRGPLNPDEINIYRGIASIVSSAGGDYDDAVRYIVEAMLQSPRFIYRLENQRGDGSLRPVGNYELANRLSYILWGGPPDDELMRAAADGKLTDRRQLEAQVDRMLDDPRTIDRSIQFVSEWLNLNRLNNLRPNPERFPEWNAELAQDMQAETQAYFREVVWEQQRPLSDLLNAELTFATGRLAKFYGIKPSGDKLQRYDVSSVPGRGGILTHGSVLTIGGDEASMVSRGLFVLHELLRGTVNAPPPCVDTTPPPTSAGRTQRSIAEARIADTRCGVCHARFEPLAFGLEKFDGIGAYHEQDEHGNKLRDDGEILFPGEAQPMPYESSEELMNLLADSERVRESLTWKVTQFALGRPLIAADAPIVKSVHEAAQQDGGTYKATIRAIVLSDLVLKTRTVPGG